MPDQYSRTPKTIVMYSTAWCPDCKRAKNFFDKFKIPYLEVDVDEDKQGKAFVMELNNGARIVPTIVFPDGSTLVEPTTPELKAKFS